MLYNIQVQNMKMKVGVERGGGKNHVHPYWFFLSSHTVTLGCFLQDLCHFCMFALCVQCCLFLITAVPYFHTHPVAQAEIVRRVLSTVIASVPVAIPTVIVSSNGACANKLRAKGIHVLNYTKLKSAADVTVACFDKTGTLTGSVVKPLLQHQHAPHPAVLVE